MRRHRLRQSRLARERERQARLAVPLGEIALVDELYRRKMRAQRFEQAWQAAHRRRILFRHEARSE